ncbi:gamma-glutamyl-gamma-aminobutyrate hydrolase family protein [Brevibacillus laterosporus]|uniref:Gamma-glutamyl-gamma-aminobutyrate hydrolase family protein n=1 Tax=Brevibacillus halotolerans TaxID=1507437 RepID=A0ABT4HZ62_9BACL|nr:MULTISPECIES: gamma-glutamyl-gamma-aminobutyrate hydrolase family protein [Brevibacillus]MCR8986346.1 gamma-glutamyl-gamma-aminobutyrate hydrolase family protein [Brevibacillus laterosporus]MCZ0832080.1 gamma-glutamyl-gamma-aminobutyrate hydrolase family protein [Brevibacillus halotolerans]GIO02264.1 gamma-glutamyl-gamma-aminobutyrate hydrolase [Brevibacillus halotolerans]
MRPVIGIASSKMYVSDNLVDHFFYTSHCYVEGIIRSGGIPLLLPLIHEEFYPIAEMLEAVDAVLLTGGVDPAPHLYGEAPHQRLGEVDYERDQAELLLIRALLRARKPMLGICRGAQMIAVTVGGSLIQDIESAYPNALQHQQIGSKQYGSHYIQVSDGFLKRALRSETVLVNSSHHQAVKTLPTGYRVTAVAPDGVIEGFESEDGRTIAVQWHPERMWMHDEQMLGICKAFVQLVNQQTEA